MSERTGEILEAGINLHRQPKLFELSPYLILNSGFGFFIWKRYNQLAMRRNRHYFVPILCLLLATQLQAISQRVIEKSIANILSQPDLTRGFWGYRGGLACQRQNSLRAKCGQAV